MLHYLFQISVNCEYFVKKILLTWLFDISIAAFQQVFNDIFVAISTRKDQRGGTVGPCADKLVNFMSRPVV